MSQTQRMVHRSTNKRNNKNRELYDKKFFCRTLVVGDKRLREVRYTEVCRYTKLNLKYMVVKSKLFIAIYFYCVTILTITLLKTLLTQTLSKDY